MLKNIKTIAVLFLIIIFSQLHAGISACLHPDGKLAIRRNWDAANDLLLLCNLGQNGQFNFSAAGLVAKKASNQDALLNTKFKWLFHKCGDAVGVFYVYPDPKKDDLYIFSGNHGYHGTTVTLPKHGYTAADVGKKIGKKNWLAKVISPDEFIVLPAANKKLFPKHAKLRGSGNFKATRIISRRYLMDGKEIPIGKIVRGKELSVIEKNGICRFDALCAAKFDHASVNDFYAVLDIGYYFHPNGSCRIDTTITFPREICIRSINPVQDHDLVLPNGGFYEKYIPKLKPIQEKPEYAFNAPVKPQVFNRPQKKRVVETSFYDFANIQDITKIRRSTGSLVPRFEISVNGGYVTPDDQPDRFIDFVGRTVKGKKSRLVGNVLGIDPAYGIARKSERSKNKTSFVLASWHKTYITQFGQNRHIFQPGTVLKSVGYRCYFNPQNIGEATSLYTIVHPDGEKIYVDFHKNVKDHLLPFAPDAEVRILEKSPAITLDGNKISVNGNCGYAVIFVPKGK